MRTFLFSTLIVATALFSQVPNAQAQTASPFPASASACVPTVNAFTATSVAGVTYWNLIVQPSADSVSGAVCDFGSGSGLTLDLPSGVTKQTVTAVNAVASDPANALSVTCSITDGDVLVCPIVGSTDGTAWSIAVVVTTKAASQVVSSNQCAAVSHGLFAFGSQTDAFAATAYSKASVCSVLGPRYTGGPCGPSGTACFSIPEHPVAQ